MKKGLFIGLCGLDVIFYEHSQFPKEDTKMKCSDVKSCIGGPAANAAITFSLLGGKSTVISYIGNSSIGNIIKKQMMDYGIDVIDLCEDDDIKCVSSIYVNMDDSSRTIFSGRNEIYKLSSFDVVQEKIKECDFVLYDGHFSHIDDVLLDSVKKFKKDLVIDVGGWKDTFDKILKYNPTLICSKVFEHNGMNGINLMDIYKYDKVAITKGNDSVEYKTNLMKSSSFIEIPVVNAIDSLGAGDVFHGTYCYFRYVENKEFKEALENATLVASYSTEKKTVIEGVKHYIELFNHNA